MPPNNIITQNYPVINCEFVEKKRRKKKEANAQSTTMFQPPSPHERGADVCVTFDQLGAGEAQHAGVSGEVQSAGQPHRPTQDIFLVVL